MCEIPSRFRRISGGGRVNFLSVSALEVYGCGVFFFHGKVFMYL
jgi:hypothetical protein